MHVQIRPKTAPTVAVVPTPVPRPIATPTVTVPPLAKHLPAIISDNTRKDQPAPPKIAAVAPIITSPKPLISTEKWDLLAAVRSKVVNKKAV